MGIASGAAAGALIGAGAGLVAGPLGATVGGALGGTIGAMGAIEGNRRYQESIDARSFRGGGGCGGSIQRSESKESYLMMSCN